MNPDHAVITTMASNMTTINTSIMSDAMSDDPSSPDSQSGFDESDLLNSSVADDVTAQLAAAGVFLLNDLCC